MSRATFETPMTLPAASLIGEAVTETLINRRPLVRRSVSMCRTLSPCRIFSRICFSS